MAWSMIVPVRAMQVDPVSAVPTLTAWCGSAWSSVADPVEIPGFFGIFALHGLRSCHPLSGAGQRM